MKRIMYVSLISLFLVSVSFAADPLLVGNFEDGSTGSGSNVRWDNWMVNTNSSAVVAPSQAATLGSHSLKWVDTDGGWGENVTKPFGEYGGTLEENIYYQALLNPGCAIVVDVTAIAGEVTDYATLELFANGQDWWGTFADTAQNIIIDGQPHTYVFYMTDEAQTALEAAIGGWGFNLGWLLSTGTGSTTLYLDNIWICPDGPVNTFGPYGRSEEQSFNAVDEDYVDVILHWKAGADPNEQFAVNPLIVDEYVFMSHNSDTDPNLYYLGATGEDPGLVDPNSQYGPIIRHTNRLFSWAVVEALDGHTQSFTPDVSKLTDVDPNNIIGPKWSFYTLSTIPIIDTQPVSTRFPVGAASASFTISVTSRTPESYQWYYSTDAVIDPTDEGGTDNPINASLGGDTNTLTITAHNKAYQAYYYCKLWNAATVSGGGVEDDVYSNVVTLVVERKVAEYLFDGSLNDTSGEGHNGTGVGSPAFVAGISGGSALSLNGTDQYVELGTAGYPKASLTEAGGIGGGLDEGSVLCWVKVNSIPTVDGTSRLAAILSSINANWPSTQFELSLESDTAATYTNARTFIIGDTVQFAWVSWRPTYVDNFNMAGDGQWHMLAINWPVAAGETQQIQVFVDGSLIATGDITADKFSAWENSMLIGAANPGAAGLTRYFDGAIDNLRVYNYVVAPEDIAQEYFNVTGKSGCIYTDFTGSNLNVDNTGTSYCRVDIADLAGFAANWLADGFYP